MLPLGSRPSSRALSQGSGSRRYFMMNTTRNAGIAPTKNIHRHWLPSVSTPPDAREAIAERTKQHPAHAPADEEQRGDVLAHRLGVTGRRQLGERRDTPQCEQSLVETIEKPGHTGGRDAGP